MIAMCVSDDDGLLLIVVVVDDARCDDARDAMMMTIDTMI